MFHAWDYWGVTCDDGRMAMGEAVETRKPSDGGLCGVTTEITMYDRATTVFWCERERGHGGTVHEGSTHDGNPARCTWPIDAPEPA